jgi:hypothetical protein
MFAMYDIRSRSQCAFAVDDDVRNVLRRRGVTREKAVFVFLATLTREGEAANHPLGRSRNSFMMRLMELYIAWSNDIVVDEYTLPP